MKIPSINRRALVPKAMGLVGLLFCYQVSCQSQSMQFIKENGQIRLVDQRRHIFTYQIHTKSKDGAYARANYIHPGNDFSGASLTEDFPEDHLHHRGVFWAWHQLYFKGVSVADPWECRDLTWQVHNLRHQILDNTAVLQADVNWLAGMEQTLLIQERVAIAYTGFEDYYFMDFSIQLESLEDRVEIGGSDDNKGYGGFSTRLALGDDVGFYNDAGEVLPSNEQVQAGNWVGVNDIGQNSIDVVIIYHPSSTANLRGWILKKVGSMQNPVWPGRNRVAFYKGDQVVIKARLVVFRSEAKTEQVTKIYQEYVNQ